MTIFIKCSHSKFCIIASYSCLPWSLHCDWAATPMSSRTAWPLISADLFHLSAFQQSYRQLNAWPIIREKLPHRLLGSLSVQLPLVRYAAPQISTVSAAWNLDLLLPQPRSSTHSFAWAPSPCFTIAKYPR